MVLPYLIELAKRNERGLNFSDYLNLHFPVQFGAGLFPDNWRWFLIGLWSMGDDRMGWIVVKRFVSREKIEGDSCSTLNVCRDVLHFARQHAPLGE